MSSRPTIARSRPGAADAKHYTAPIRSARKAPLFLDFHFCNVPKDGTFRVDFVLVSLQLREA